jgi:hypothetical protein
MLFCSSEEVFERLPWAMREETLVRTLTDIGVSFVESPE